jgi:uncharacterized protein (DUF697 family)
MTPRARDVVKGAGLGTAVVAAILSPIPLADELVLLPALLWVGAAVGRDRGLALGDLPWRAFTTTALVGLGARAGLNLAVSFLPGVAAVANAVSAFALTWAYAHWADAACADPEHARAPTPQSFAELLRA